jgi:ubiquinone biosynthesis protein COQ4
MVIEMGYMDLMSKAENIGIIGKMMRDVIEGNKSDPVNTAFDLEDSFARTTWMDACVERVKENPDSARLIEERYMGPEYNLDELLKQPKESFGYTYAKMMTLKGFTPHFYRDRPSVDDERDYVTMRVRKTHDLYHTLSGFSMHIGEMGVIGLNSTQQSYPAFALMQLVALTTACFPGMIHLAGAKDIDSAKLAGAVFDTISMGVNMGRKANPLFPLKFEEMLKMPLEEVIK